MNHRHDSRPKMLCLFQGSRTYLEKKFEEFKKSSLEELIQHGLRSLESCIQDGELDSTNCTIGVVGKDMPFTVMEGDDLQPHIDLLQNRDSGVEQVAEEAGAEEGAEGDAPAAQAGDAMEEG